MFDYDPSDDSSHNRHQNDLGVLADYFETAGRLELLTTLGLSFSMVSERTILSIGTLPALKHLTFHCPLVDEIRAPPDLATTHYGGDSLFRSLQSLHVRNVTPRPLAYLLGCPGMTDNLVSAHFDVGNGEEADEFLPVALQRLIKPTSSRLRCLRFDYPLELEPYQLSKDCFNSLKSAPLTSLTLVNVQYRDAKDFSFLKSSWSDMTILRWRHQPATYEDLRTLAKQRPNLEVLAVDLQLDSSPPLPFEGSPESPVSSQILRLESGWLSLMNLYNSEHNTDATDRLSEFFACHWRDLRPRMTYVNLFANERSIEEDERVAIVFNRVFQRLGELKKRPSVRYWGF